MTRVRPARAWLVLWLAISLALFGVAPSRATVNNSANKVVVAGNGVITVFNFSFIAVAPSDLQVILTDSSGNETTLAPSSYSVTLTTLPPGQIWSIGGTVSYPLTGSPIPNGSTLTIVRNLSLTQLVALNNQGNLFPTAVETGLDLLEMQLQQVNELFGRAIVAPATDPSTINLILPPAAQRANTGLAFDSQGNVIAGTTPATGLISTPMQPVVDAASLALGRTAFGLGSTATTSPNCGLQSGVSAAGNLDVNFATTQVATSQSIAAANCSTIYVATGPLTFTLPRANTLWNGFGFWVHVVGGGTATLTPNAMDTIEGFASGASAQVPIGAWAWIVTDAATSGNWRVAVSYELGSVPNSYNVTDFNAKCDGTTDDTAAINTALATIPSGATLVFPSTSCLVASTTGSPANPHSIPIAKPVHISFANGGGITSTVTSILFDIQSNNVTIDGSNAAVLNGSWSTTTYTAFDIAIGSNDYDNVSTVRSNIKISGIQIQNWADGGVFVWYLNDSIIENLTVNNIAYAGIFCAACDNSQAVHNVVSNIWSSTGPDQPGNPVYRANHYGIAFSTNLAVTSRPLNDLVIGNIVNNVPAWECYDTHGAEGITFAGNIGTNCGIGISVNSPGALDITNINVSNNQITCIPLGSPVYSGSSGLSVGGQGISVVGLSSSNFGAPIDINGNTTNGCGPDNLSLEGDTGAYFVAIVAGMSFNNNVAYNSRYASFAFGQFVIGGIFGNLSEGLVAGPVGGTPSAFNLLGQNFQINMGSNTASGTGYNGYNLAAQITGFNVSISRTNVFQGVSTLHVGSGTYTDLGTTAP